MKENEKKRNASNSDDEDHQLSKNERSPKGKSIAGESAWGGSSIGKGSKAPVVSNAAGATSHSKFETNPMEDLGFPKLNDQLRPLREQRLKLEELKVSLKKTKRKSKSPKKKSALKNASSVFETEDAISAYTGYTSEMDRLIEVKDKITVDYFPM